MAELPDRFAHKEKRFRRKFALVTFAIAGLSAMHAAMFFEASSVFFCSRAWCSFVVVLLSELGILWLYYVLLAFVAVLLHLYLSEHWQQRLEDSPELGPDPIYGDLSDRDKQTNRIVVLVVLALLSFSLSHPNVGGMIYPIRVTMILTDFRFGEPFVVTFRYLVPIALVVTSVLLARKNANKFLALKIHQDETPTFTINPTDSLIPLIDFKETHTLLVYPRCTVKPCLAVEIRLEELSQRFIESEFAMARAGDVRRGGQAELASRFDELALLEAGTRYVRLVYDRHFDHVVFPRPGSNVDSLVELLDEVRADCALTRVTTGN